jgi:alternate signal-mediated exported protein
MNSTTKGSLAAVVAALLLTGGAGTLAYWNDTENVPGGPISSGQLDLGHARLRRRLGAGRRGHPHQPADRAR